MTYTAKHRNERMKNMDSTESIMAPLDGRATLLAVDDNPTNLYLLAEVLRTEHRVLAARSGQHALVLAAAEPKPDLVLLDVMMPGMDGFQVLAGLRGNPATCEIPVIFVTAANSTEDEERGFELGAADYILKPLRPAVVRARVRAQIEAKRGRDFLRHHNRTLEGEIARRLRENQLIQDVSIHALAYLAETRDPETGNHLRRTQAYVRALAVQLRGRPGFEALDSDIYLELLAKSAPLHDIGKVGIPDNILLKPARLDAREWAIMRTHAQLGAEAIERAERDADQRVEFLTLAKQIARWHHERWDGGGYPDGLAGADIPISARLMALADVFDALISARAYKPAMAAEDARDMILAARGRHFDPAVADAFESVFVEFRDIAGRYGDLGASK